MQSPEEVRQVTKRWMLERPQLQTLFERFPPGCEVRPLRPLVCPRVGARAWIVSYTEDGQVSVMQDGNSIRGFCDPDWLEVVAYQAEMTPDWVRHVFAS